LKINRIMPFCNLFMGWPSYVKSLLTQYLVGILPDLQLRCSWPQRWID